MHVSRHHLLKYSTKYLRLVICLSITYAAQSRNLTQSRNLSQYHRLSWGLGQDTHHRCAAVQELQLLVRTVRERFVRLGQLDTDHT